MQPSRSAVIFRPPMKLILVPVRARTSASPTRSSLGFDQDEPTSNHEPRQNRRREDRSHDADAQRDSEAL